MAREMKDSGVAWIGEIPADWEKNKIIRIFEIIGSGTTPKAINEQNLDGEVYWIQSGDITGNYILIAKNKISEATIEKYSALKIYSAPFIVVAMYGASIGNLAISNINACVNQACCVLKGSNIDFRFSYYTLQAAQNHLIQQGIGGGQPNISQEVIKQLWVPVPPQDEQKWISSLLDKKCAEINAVLAKTRTSIEEYKKLKQAIIAQAVTKGVRGDRPMKESGIEWANLIPLEWESVNPKALFSQRKEKAAPGERQLTSSQKYGIVYQDDYMELTGSRVAVVQKDFDILKHVEAGDFIISMRSFQGGLEYSTKTGSISSAYVMLIPNLNLVYPRFYRWLLKSEVYIRALQRTSNMVRDGQAMRYSNFAQVRLYTVPLQEQMEIADYLDEKCAELDALIEKKEKFVSEIESYKKSLIYEYVTGKKEV